MRKFLSQLTSVATVSALALTLTVDANAASQQTTGNFIDGGLKNLPAVERTPQLKSRTVAARHLLDNSAETSAAGRLLRSAAGTPAQIKGRSFEKSVSALPKRQTRKAPLRAGAQRENAFMMDVLADLSWTANGQFGMYSMPLTGGDLTLNSSESYFGYIYFAGYDGACYIPSQERFIANYYNQNSGALYTIVSDATTWTPLSVLQPTTFSVVSEFGMACDPTDPTAIYSVFYTDDASGLQFGKWNYTQNASTKIKDITSYTDLAVSLAFDNEGNLYGIRADGAFCSVDKTTGNLTPVIAGANIGQGFSFGLAYNDQDGCFYANDESSLVTDEEGNYVSGAPSMVKIDLTDNTVTKVCEFNNMLMFNGLFITGVADPYSPAAPADLKADFGGTLSGKVTFTAPSTKVNGDRLIGQVDYYVLLNGTEVATGKATAGSAVEETVTVDAVGYHTIEVYCESRDGAGASATVTAWAGRVIAAPNELGDVIVTENPAKPGEVTIAWNAVQAAPEAADFNAADYTYTIVCFQGNDQIVVAENLTETTYTYQVVTEGQAFVGYAVVPVSDMEIYYDAAGYSYDMAVGVPLALPFTESFENLDDINDNWQISASGGSLYLAVKDIDASRGSRYLALVPADPTSTTAQYARAQISSKKISFKGATEPTLTFDYYDQPGATDFIAVYALVAGEPTQVAEVDCGAATTAGWQSEVVNLSDLAGKEVQLAFLLVSTDFKNPVMIDNINVRNLVDNDLNVANVNMPAKMTAGVATDVTVTLENLGKNAVAEYTVDIFVNEAKVATATGSNIASGAMADVALSFTPLVTWPELNTVTATVSFAADQVMENNSLTIEDVALIKSDYPAPTALQGEDKGNAVELTWGEPDAPVEAPVTESFDDGEAYSVGGFNGWTFVDADLDDPYVFQGADFPNQGDPCAWIVFPATNPSALKPHSGDNYLAGFCGENKPADNWMISPLLSGKAQTISFYAAEVTAQYGAETLEVLYSTTDTELTSFTKVADFNVTTTTWTEFTANLPEGAKYFAIRQTSNDIFMVGVDDVTFTPAVPNLSLVGFNVYVDGQKVNDELVTDFAYTYAAAAGAHEYAVSAVYDLGESPACAPITVTSSGVADILAAGVAVYANAGEIVVANAAGQTVTVYAIDGKTLYNAVVADQANIPVATGVYIVKVGENTAKLAVK